MNKCYACGGDGGGENGRIVRLKSNDHRSTHSVCRDCFYELTNALFDPDGTVEPSRG